MVHMINCAYLDFYVIRRYCKFRFHHIAVSCAGGVACFGHNCSGSYSTCVDGYCRCPDNPDRDYCTCLGKEIDEINSEVQ